jgi:hypothetical protein
VQKKQEILAFQILHLQCSKKVGPSKQYTSFFFNQTATTVFKKKRSRSRRAKRAVSGHGARLPLVLVL